MALRVFLFFFIKLTFRWLQTGLSDLKNTKTIEILLMVDFLRIFKMLHFSKFSEIFEIHPYFQVKLLNALNFIRPNTVELD